MPSDLVEAFRNATKKHKVGGITLVCLDDESLDESEYGRMGDRTVVPRARDEGGIMGLPLGPDCKYGKGVTRRFMGQDENGAFVVEKEIENFRPDQADQGGDLFSDEELQAAGVEYADEEELDDEETSELRSMMESVMSEIPQVPAQPQQPGISAVASNQPSEMMQMMQMMMQMMNQQQRQQRKKEKPAEPEKPKGKTVVFEGNFGRMQVRYAAVQIEPEFLVLISSPDQPTMYEPPLSSQNTIDLMVEGKHYTVVNLGLSFTYKGDILLLMPLASNTDTDNAEEE